ncbi:YwqG family protein [Streptomyces tsukubensis]|uniref:DUF1963 domain-containing protein n=1 Tax=Streptomyces tsukubensis TaxID=83656 RepID=A0A1V4A5S5_9ACTN|nr:YwqG family protein [Streptomyces tsukubensis]OON75989.1 hypothetical protein B1H18_21910 [Streptomyces tsukubensis]QFR94079.1 DUF1963 domain-containing protein [Streptomyces tsukubensis]
MTHASAEALRALAEKHLSPEASEAWTGLLRPAVRLSPASGADPVVARLGGLPALPADVPWPEWAGHGPLSFVASVDCAALPSDSLDIPFPSEGSLAFFYFDGSLDGGLALVGPSEPGSEDGSRVIHIPASAAAFERPAPEGLTAYPEVPLTARRTHSAAQSDHPLVAALFADGAPSAVGYDHPVASEDFADALWELEGDTCHAIGGYADPVQGPVELEIAKGALGEAVEWEDPAVYEEAGAWTLLAQFDTDDDADMMWGDAGVLYWLIRPTDLAELRFDRARFTWQCA